METESAEELDYDKLWESVETNSGNCKATENASELNGELLPMTVTSRKIDISSKMKKFERLKKKSEEIRHFSKLRQLRTEKYKLHRLEKKKLKRGLAEENEDNRGKAKEGWKNVKPFLTVNDHLQGPISHGDCGPKTELECMVDDAIKHGDLEQAEILSDTLANRQFAVKIANAFDAKRYSEQKAKEEELLKAKKLKKIRWGFEAKERWEMKGNM